MIEKLPNTPVWKPDPLLNMLREPGTKEIAAKLNEVIEAVNILDIYVMNAHRGDDGESVYQKVDRYKQEQAQSSLPHSVLPDSSNVID